MFEWWQFLLVLVAVCFLLSFIYAKIEGLDIDEFFAIGIVSSVIVFICYCVIMAAGSTEASYYIDEENIKYYYKAKENLLTLQDETEISSNLSGSYMKVFTIGVGSINSSSEVKKYYYTMVGTNEEGYILKKYSCDNTYLFFDEEENPYIQIKKKRYVYKYGRNWIYGGLLKPLSNSERKYETIKTELHVPKDTIKISYNVDIQ